MANLTLRLAKREDARAIAEIHVAAWRAAYRGLMPDDYLASLSVDERTTMWQNALGRATPAQFALAEINGTLAGFCIYGPTRDKEPPEVAEIYAVNIHPDHWRRGAGRLLCEHALREAAAREHSTITLWVMTGNERARVFYERLGFAPDGARRTDSQLIGRPIDELRYRKSVA